MSGTYQKLVLPCQPKDYGKDLLVDYNSITFKNIAVVSNKNGYRYLLENILPLYSNFWIYSINEDVENMDLNQRLKMSIENNSTNNIIIFGIQNYSKLKIKTNRILNLDYLVKILANTKNENADKILAASIQSFIYQWQSIDRIPGQDNWMNSEWSKKGGLFHLL